MVIITNNTYGIIYCALNIVNGKRYIGQTIRGLSVRKKEHLLASKNGSDYAIHKAIRKYGESNFEWLIIDTANNQNELDEKEIYWIDFYDSYHNGYNMSVGGQFNKRTDENADEISLMYGGREFLIFDSDGNYKESRISQSEFARELDVVVASVHGVLSGRKPQVKGNILIYKDEYSDELLKSKVRRVKEWHKDFAVFDMENNLLGIWDNKFRCSEELNISRNSLIDQLNKSGKINPRKFKAYYLDILPIHLQEKVKDVIT